MRLVKSELRSYYRARGLAGNSLKRAVWGDVLRVRKNQDMPDERYASGHGLSARFGFVGAPEGSVYWGIRAFPWSDPVRRRQLD